jgi:cullin-associated NEDD8-dissociated protein 1
MVKTMTEKAEPMKSALYSLKGYQRMLTGAPLTPDIINAGEGVIRFTEYAELAEEIKAISKDTSKSVMAETYAAVLENSLRSTEALGDALGNTTLESGRDFKSNLIVDGQVGRNQLAEQFLEVSKVIQLDTTSFEMERSAFYTALGGWDSHGAVDISTQVGYVNEALEMLTDELKDQGVWDDVAIVCVSDFGRTLTSNSQGTDHGWGGNYWVAGGGVKGKQMLGKFPSRFTEFESDVNVGRGRFIPTTPWCVLLASLFL